MSNSKRRFIHAAIAFCALIGLPAMPVHADDAAAPINSDENKVAIQGYDTVSYFTLGHPEKGSAENEIVWRNARWWFASKANLEKFSVNPASYAPQFGGFCAGAAAMGQAVKANPEAWAIVDGKLYMYFDKPGRQEASESLRADIVKAEANWPKVQPQN